MGLYICGEAVGLKQGRPEGGATGAVAPGAAAKKRRGCRENAKNIALALKKQKTVKMKI